MGSAWGCLHCGQLKLDPSGYEEPCRRQCSSDYPPEWQRGGPLFTGFPHPLLQGCSVGCNSLGLPDRCECPSVWEALGWNWNGRDGWDNGEERESDWLHVCASCTNYVLSLIHSCHCLEIRNNLWKGAFYFNFCTEPSKLCSSWLLNYFPWNWSTAWHCTMAGIKKLFEQNVRSGTVDVWYTDLMFIISLPVRVCHPILKMKKQIQVG